HAAVVELDALPDPVRPRAEDHDARSLARGRYLVLLAPGRVEVVRGGLDLAAARVDAAIGRADAARVARAAHVVARGAPRRADRVVPPTRALRAADVAGAQLPLRELELLDEPRMQPVRQVVDRRPGRRGAGIELPRAERFEERLAERPPDPHRLADRLHLRAERGVRPGEL